MGVVLGRWRRFFSCCRRRFEADLECSLVIAISGSGEMVLMDSGFKSGLRLMGVSGTRVCTFSGTGAGVEYKLDWTERALSPPPRNLFSSSLSSEEIMDTWDRDLVMLFFRLACCRLWLAFVWVSASANSIRFAMVSLIVG